MAPASSLDYWRGFFREARADIFDCIDAAIRVAAADHPEALRARRDAIAERLYTALIAPQAGLPAPGQPALLHPEGAGSFPSLCSSDRSEVVTDDGGAALRNNSDDAVVAEAFRVKAALSNAHEKSEAELIELLQKLHQLEFTVGAITATEIGKAVKPLRKHDSKQIRQLVRSLIEVWKATVNDWMNDGDPIVGHTPQSVGASCPDQDEGGLPSPPMDEAALFEAPCSSIQLSEFFDEMDDDGNIRSDVKECRKCSPRNEESVKKQSPMDHSYDPEQNWRLDKSAMKQAQSNEPFNWQTKQQSNAGAQGRPSNAASGQDASMSQRRQKTMMPKKPSPRHDENSVRAKLELAKEAKLEATKRKLQEGYQEFNNAKKQRTVQMVDPQDLPKQGNRKVLSNAKARNNNRMNRLGIRR